MAVQHSPIYMYQWKKHEGFIFLIKQIFLFKQKFLEFNFMHFVVNDILL